MGSLSAEYETSKDKYEWAAYFCYVYEVSNLKKGRHRQVMGSSSADYGTSKDEYELATYLFVLSMQSPIRKKNRQVMGSSSADYETSKDEWNEC